MERGTYLSFICTRLALALSTTAVGLVVAIVALGCFNWLSERLSMLDAEMRVAYLELRKVLDRQSSGDSSLL
jgi:biopolymer transport protein ExbB/TolQ